MLPTDTSPRPADTAELVIDLLTGHDNEARVAHTLGVPVGQVRGWCERIRNSFGLGTTARHRWRSETGDVRVIHTASYLSPLVPGTMVTFTVEVRNETPATLYGVHLVQRAFTNANWDHLDFDTAWQFLQGSHAVLPPGGIQRYGATYTVAVDDLTPDGDIINAIAISGYTSAGHQIWIERDAMVSHSEPITNAQAHDKATDHPRAHADRSSI